MYCTWGRGGVFTQFRWENLKEREYFEDPGIGGRVILSWIFRTCDRGAETGLTWLRRGTGGRNL